jgi:hypothetical protein
MFASTLDIGDHLYQLGLALLALLTTAVNLWFVHSRTKELKPNGGSSIKDQMSVLAATAPVIAHAVAPETALPTSAEAQAMEPPHV